ncbi:P2X purinoceptor 7-like [Haliotis asinina]|uniref:P2X purinoceptor 7-like n=1 Tax=Haliotis asinina TaxID=109174 RepID=UPI0035327253
MPSYTEAQSNNAIGHLQAGKSQSAIARQVSTTDFGIATSSKGDLCETLHVNIGNNADSGVANISHGHCRGGELLSSVMSHVTCCDAPTEENDVDGDIDHTPLLLNPTQKRKMKAEVVYEEGLRWTRLQWRNLLRLWCRCGNCRPMPSAQENKCCWQTGSSKCAVDGPNCFTVISPAVLDIAMAHYNDIFVHDQERNNAAYRHQAYRQFTLQRFGRLGQGNRRVVPSCVVLAIHRRYPDPTGIYTGYKEM